MKYYILTLLILITIFAFNLKAQNPSPAPTQNSPILLKGGMVHVGNGTVIENGIITFENGKLTFVGAANEYNYNGKSFLEFDVSGKHVYPGLISCNSTLGLSEIRLEKATNDYYEVGDFNPSVRSLIAYNTDSEKIPINRSNGILLAQIVPRGGTVSGSSSVVNLDAWNWEDAVVRADEGIHFNWPTKYNSPRRWMGETEPQPNENYSITIQTIEKNLKDALAYSKQEIPDRINLKLDAMAGLFNGNSTLYLHVNKAAEIVKSIQLMQKCNVNKIVLVGAADAYYVKAFIMKNNIPVILKSTHSLPARPEEDVANPYKLPFLLSKEGILVTIEDNNQMNISNLPFLAGTAAAYGLTKEEALSMITLNPARILGIVHRVGTIEVGKDATIIVSEGDLLDMMSNKVELAFIEGRKIDLDNKHKRLYQKFKAKYD